MGAYMMMMMMMLQESILQYSLVFFMCAKQSGIEVLDTVGFLAIFYQGTQ